MDIHRVWLIYHAPWKKNGTALEIFQKHQRQDWRKRWKDWGPPAFFTGSCTRMHQAHPWTLADSAMRQRMRSEVHQFHHELRSDAPSSLEQELTCCYHPWGSHPEEAQVPNKRPWGCSEKIQRARGFQKSYFHTGSLSYFHVFPMVMLIHLQPHQEIYRDL